MYATKNFFYNLYVVLLNGFYWWRFYWKARRGKFNQDFYNEPTKDGWDVTFQDDFDGEEINWNTKGGWNKWYSENQMGSPDTTASDYSLDCIKVKDGKLHLYTKTNEEYPDSSGYPLKTGLLNSWYGNDDIGFKQQFGYFETCCKVPPNGLTFWAAFWLYGNTWPPEVDIFEFMSEEDIDTGHSKGISMTLHWGPNNKTGMRKASQLGRTFRKMLGSSVNFDEHFHVYACRWEWDYIEWYIDNVPVYRTTYNIPDNQMSIIINSGAKLGMLPRDEQMPQDFIVDYIRAYKKSN